MASRRAAAFVLAAVVLTPAGDLRAQERFTLEPTPLEAFAARADARIVWSQALGRLESGASMAEVTAIVVESPSTSPKTMRGIRIDLTYVGPGRDCQLIYVEWSLICERNPAAVYVEERRLDVFRRDVLRGDAEVHDGHPYGVTTYSCNRCSGPDSGEVSGILVLGHPFPHRTLSDFAILVAGAMTALESAPR